MLNKFRRWGDTPHLVNCWTIPNWPRLEVFIQFKLFHIHTVYNLYMFVFRIVLYPEIFVPRDRTTSTTPLIETFNRMSLPVLLGLGSRHNVGERVGVGVEVGVREG